MHHRLPNHLSALRKARKDEGGFTLIELLIVIVILGVLAGIVVFSVRGITDRGDTAACKAEVKTVEVAVEALLRQERRQPGQPRRRWSPDFLRSRHPSVRGRRRQPARPYGSLTWCGSPAAAACLIGLT